MSTHPNHTTDAADDLDWGLWPEPPERPSAFPPIRIFDVGNELIVQAEIPGVDEGDVDVKVTRDLLTISGLRRPHVPHSFSQRKSERAGGRFERQLKLYSRVDPRKADADLDAGVLNITLSKVSDDACDKIPVREI